MDVTTKSLRLIEIFASIQGETSTSGLPTTFIRLASCNLRCTWCDSTYTFGRGTPYSFTKVLQTVEEFGLKEICITGGEPLLQQDVHTLMSILCDRDYSVQIETGGSLPTTSIDPRVRTILDVKCPASGMAEKNDLSNLTRLRKHDEVKFVLADRNDYDFAKGILKRYALQGNVSEILFSPVFSTLDAKELISWILEDKLSFVRLNLQIHKFIWDPNTKGV